MRQEFKEFIEELERGWSHIEDAIWTEKEFWEEHSRYKTLLMLNETTDDQHWSEFRYSMRKLRGYLKRNRDFEKQYGFDSDKWLKVGE